ncbi:MAG: methyltransferase domain-containing protein [Candidatus Ozemobacteraceae bacterium]
MNKILQMLENTLVCPWDRSFMNWISGAFKCPTCSRSFSHQNNRTSFPPATEKLTNSSLTGTDLPDFSDPNFFNDSLVQSSIALREIPAIRELAVELVAGGGILVDLATGPGGGLIPALAKRMMDGNFCIGTDLNPAVAKGWGDLFFGSELGREKFTMLELDLTAGLPFRQDSVTAFIGAGVGNILDLGKVVKEARECLKPDGYMVFLEWLFPEDSPSGIYLKKNFPQVICTRKGYQDICDTESFNLELSEVLRVERGKRSEGDSLPLNEDEEMFLHLVRLSFPNEKHTRS